MIKKTDKQDKDIRSPKGMRDVWGDEYYRLQGLFEKAQEIAVYYGFKPIETPMLEQEALFSRGVGEHTDIVEKEMYNIKTRGGDHLVMRPEGTAPIMRAYIEHGMQSWPQPVMLYYGGPFFRHENPQRGRFREFRQFGFEILGTQKSIADAIVIRTIIDVLEEVGLKDLSVDINSIGCSTCRPAYVRALIAYYKKHLKEACPQCRVRLLENPLRVLDCKNKECQPIKEGAPQTVGHLCDECRKHFKEVLEYLGTSTITYTINHGLVRGLDYYTRTVFEIMQQGEGATELAGDEKNQKKESDKEPSRVSAPITIAAGGRYDNLAKTIGGRKPVSAVGGSIGMERVLMMPNIKSIDPRILKKPKAYFIQLGFEARLKSLAVIEILRKAKVPLMQSLSKDSLSLQLAAAEKSGLPYVIIFGQKEAMDGTVIVRNMENRSQDTIKIAELAEYLKHMK